MIRLHAARWAALPALAAVLAASGCGIRSTGIVSAGDPPPARGYADTMTIYLVRDGKLWPVTRPGVPGEPYLAVEQLTVEPTTRERAAGLHTEVGRPLNTYVVADAPGQSVDEPSTLAIREVDQPTPQWSRTAVAQIVCTAQAIPGIGGVVLFRAPNREGKPVRCAQFADLLS